MFPTPHVSASHITSDLREAAQTEGDEHREHDRSGRTGKVCWEGDEGGPVELGWGGGVETQWKSPPLKSQWQM